MKKILITGGSIVNITSVNGIRSIPGTAMYGASKQAIESLLNQPDAAPLFRALACSKRHDKGPRHTEEMTMPRHNIFATPFAKVYPMYVQKAERKNRTKEDVDQIICWLTGYDHKELEQQIAQGSDFETFFAQAPVFNPNASLLKGVVCGIRVEEIADPLMQKIRYLDKLIDELAKGKAMAKILRE